MTVFLITGASRGTVPTVTSHPSPFAHADSVCLPGLGLALVAALLLRPNHVVVATTRSTSTPSSLSSLPRHPTSRLIHVPLSFPSVATQANPVSVALATFTSAHPEITHIDTVIANAATVPQRSSVLELAPENLLEAFTINSLAPVLLFQGAWPLLQNAGSPKFVMIGSVAGSVAGVEQTGGWANAAYGASKVAGHYLTRKLCREIEGALAVSVIHPG